MTTALNFPGLTQYIQDARLMEGPRKSAKHDIKHCNQKYTISQKNIVWQNLQNKKNSQNNFFIAVLMASKTYNNHNQI